MNNFFLVIISIFTLATSVYSENIVDIEKKIKEYENKIKQSKYGLKEKQKKEKELEYLKNQVIKNRLNLNELIKRLDQNIENKKKDINLIDKLIKDYRKQIWYYEFKINQLNSDLNVYKKKLSKRLVYFYKKRRWSNLEILFNNNQINDLLKKFKYLKILSENDNRIIEELKKKKEEINKLKKKVETSLEKEEKFKKRQQDILQSLLQDKRNKNKIIKELLKKESIYKAQIIAIKKEQEKLNNMLMQMAQKKKEFENILKLFKSEFEAKKGFLPWPVSSKKILIGFGNYYDKNMNVERFNKGIDIKVKENEEVRAISKGIVRFADFFEGYGKTIIIDHGGEYFSIYANLSDIYVSLGQEVETLQIIGNTGSTGLTAEPKLHFEIRKNTRALNPVIWLSK